LGTGRNRVECAVAGESKYIISGDKHLLKIKQYKEIRIRKASDFLQEALTLFP
jgi:predicted nucleic acid-binding protein